MVASIACSVVLMFAQATIDVVSVELVVVKTVVVAIVSGSAVDADVDAMIVGNDCSIGVVVFR